MVLGGSQGSIFINNLIKNWIEKNRSDNPPTHKATEGKPFSAEPDEASGRTALNKNLSNIQIIHQTGDSDSTNWDEFYSKQNIPAYYFKYSNKIKEFYQISDLVICRAGAGTLFELEFFAKKALIIPLETVYTDHQLDNALAMAKKNQDLFKVIRQREISENFNLGVHLSIQSYSA